MAKAVAKKDEDSFYGNEEIEMLRNITSFQEAVSAVTEEFGDVIDANEEIGTGFQILDNKDILCGVPFLIIKWEFHDSKKYKRDGEPSGFVSAFVVTENDERYVLNDGGTGICKQLLDLSSRMKRYGGLLVRHGLKRSDYDTEEFGEGTTYYLSV